MTDDLAQWLTQIWDEDEARVRAAIADDGGQDGGFEDDFARLTGHGPLGVLPRFGEAAARMIVWQTPRRDLDRLAADRQILALHHPNGRNILGYPVCDACTPLKPTPCPTVRLLALPYADRPGYQEEWRP